MKNKNILIGLVGLGILYALYMKNKNKPKTYSKACYDALERRLIQEDNKPPNFNQTFLENCSKTEIKNKKCVKWVQPQCAKAPCPQICEEYK